MYMHAQDGLEHTSSSPLAAPPNVSAADARVLAQAGKFAQTVNTAVREIEGAVKLISPYES